MRARFGLRLNLKRDARAVFCLRSLRLFPLTGEGQPYLSRFDLNFDENRKVEYVVQQHVSGGALPSEGGGGDGGSRARL